MPKPLMSIEVDTAALFAAMDQFASRLDTWTMAVSYDTAKRVEAEAKRRIRRRTGETGNAIHVERDDERKAWLVKSPPPQVITLHTRRRTGRMHSQRTLVQTPVWLEFGTTHQVARPYFFDAGRLEEAGHRRRMVQAIEDGLEQTGLGD